MTTDKLQQIADAVDGLESSLSSLDMDVSALDGQLDLMFEHMHQRFDALEKLVIDGFKALGVAYEEPPSKNPEKGAE